MKREQSLLEVSMMLGDAIDKLNALSAYKDPYAHLKEAHSRGETIQIIGAGGKWIDYTWGCPDWTMGVDGYRIKPKTKTVYLWVMRGSNADWWVTDCKYATAKEAECGFDYGTAVQRIEQTAIEVEV